MIVPILERPDAEAAPGAPARCRCTDWTDGDDPYAATARAARPGRAATRSPTRPGRCTCSACSTRCPTSSYVSMTDRAADAARGQGRRRARAAGRRGRRGRRELRGDRRACASPGRTRERDRRRPRRPAAQARPLAGRLHRRRLRARTAPTRTTRWATASIEEGDMVVLDFGGLKDGYGSDTTRTVHVGEPTDEEREVLRDRPPRAAGRLRGRAPRASPARRSTAPRAR